MNRIKKIEMQRNGQADTIKAGVKYVLFRFIEVVTIGR